ncbi:MAG: chemotactic signal-response protein chel [Alphaproteobacteria bacterium]|nr:chemotactic signal-response protein chel [Alphaproteobacteria bacterium]
MFGSASSLMAQNMGEVALGEARSSAYSNANVQTKEEAKKTAKEFEAFFLSQCFSSMYEGIGTDGMFGGGHAEKMFRSMMIDEYGKMIATNGGVGISDQLASSMIEMQEKMQ